LLPLSCHDHDLVRPHHVEHRLLYKFLKRDNSTAKRSHLSIASGHLRAVDCVENVPLFHILPM